MPLLKPAIRFGHENKFRMGYLIKFMRKFKNNFKTIFLIAFVFASIHTFSQTVSTVNSPSGKLNVTVKVNESGAPIYAVQLNGEVFLEDSPLGMKTSIGDFSENLKFVKN